MFPLEVAILRKEHLLREKEQCVLVGKGFNRNKHRSPEPGVSLVGEQQPGDGV